MLALEMDLPVRPTFYEANIPSEARVSGSRHKFRVPYSRKTGARSDADDKVSTWDLSMGAKIKLTGGPGKGFVGEVVGFPRNGNLKYTVSFPCTREGKNLGKGKRNYALCVWFVESACKGTLPQLPFVNVRR